MSFNKNKKANSMMQWRF